jgi:lipoprotein-anchoring transpeptidase ErfK/SrfK
LAWLWWQQRIPPNATVEKEWSPSLDRPLYASTGPLQTIPPANPINKSNSPGAVPRPTTPRLETNLTEATPQLPPNAKARTSVAPATSAPPAMVTNQTPLTRTNSVSLTSWSRALRETAAIQIGLARLGISSGSIDGKMGPQTRAALRAFQIREHLAESGEMDAATTNLLALAEPLFATYLVSSNDLARLTSVGATWLAKSGQPRLDYETILELVSEKAHAHPSLLRWLNHEIDWTNVVVGTAVNVPSVRYPIPASKAAFIRIRLAEKTLQAFDASTNLLAHFPCSIAQRVEKRPLGQLFVERLVSNPNYRFDPAIFPESPEALELGRVLIIPPGPNNPVGTAWIGLNRPGYGIHGTPLPEEVGRTESHGCFRLANWNAEYLLQLVNVGTPVLVEP